MDVFESFAKRRMTRAFTADPVEALVVDRLLYAAMRAPSAGNTASVEMLVLTGDQCHDYWDVTLSAARRTGFPWPGLLLAPVLLIPTVDPGAYVERYGDDDKAHTGLGESADAWSVPYWWVDGGAAVENVLLAAISLGLGACFFGQFEHEAAVSARFGIPDGRRAVGTIAVGHPDPDNDRPSRSSQRPTASATDRTHWGRW